MLLIEANQILGIDASTSLDDAKKAYRTQVLRWHPDKNGNSPEACEHFKEVQEAWEVYTKYNPCPVPGSSSSSSSRTRNPDDVSNLFKEFLNNAWREWGPKGQHNSSQSGESKDKRIRIDVLLNIKDILYNNPIPINYTRTVKCKCSQPTAKFCMKCKGTGWCRGRCDECEGDGFLYCGKCKRGWKTIHKKYDWNTKELVKNEWVEGPYVNKRRGVEIWWKPSDSHWYVKNQHLYIEITIDLLDSLIGLDTNKTLEGKSFNITSKGRTIQKGWGLSYKNTMFPEGPPRIIWFVKRITYPTKISPQARQWLSINGL